MAETFGNLILYEKIWTCDGADTLKRKMNVHEAASKYTERKSTIEFTPSIEIKTIICKIFNIIKRLIKRGNSIV
jgi:hypothetical protein